MQLPQYYFRFSLLGTIMAVLGIALFSGLGSWQVQRAQEKHELQLKMDNQNQQPAISLNHFSGDIKQRIFTPVIATGFFDKHNEILIDNEVYKGKAGYHVLTPLKLESSDKVIIVNRGWISQGRSREELPQFNTPSELIEIKGTINDFKSKPALVLDNALNSGKVWSFFDYDKYMQTTKYHLLPVLIQMDQHSPYGFTRDWPHYDAKEGMHIGYAIQWYAFAVIVIATYLGLNIKKKTGLKGHGRNI